MQPGSLLHHGDEWRDLRLRPRVLRDVTKVDTRVTLLDKETPSPILIAPTAFHAMATPAGELATARAAGAARTLILLGRDEAAEVEFAAVAQLGDPRDVPIERAEAQLRAGDPRRALASVEHAEDADRSSRLAFLRARALLALGRREAALEEGRRALALDPGNRRYQDWLAAMR